MLRDTGAGQSLIVDSVLPFSTKTFIWTKVLVHGVELGRFEIPLHNVFMKSRLVTGQVQSGVCSRLPVDGVDLTLGNVWLGIMCFPKSRKQILGDV